VLEFFRKNLFLYNALLLLYCVILRLVGFVKTIPVSPDSNLFSTLLADFFGGSQSILANLFSIVIILVNAFQINRLVNLNRITPNSSLFPGLFYILISSMALEFQGWHHIHLANSFVILVLLEVFQQTRNERLLIRTFNVGFLAGAGSLFFVPYVLLLPLGIAGMINVRTFKRMDYFRVALGFISPYLILISLLFYSGQLELMWSGHFQNSFSLFDFNEVTWQQYLIGGIFLVGVILVVFNMGALTLKSNIHTRRKMNTLLVFLLVFTAIIPLMADAGVDCFLMIAVPFGIFLGALFLRMDKQWAEILHFLLLALALAFQWILA